MNKILTLEQINNTSFEEILNLYRQGYKLNEITELAYTLCPDCPNIYPSIDDVVPHSRSGYNFA